MKHENTLRFSMYVCYLDATSVPDTIIIKNIYNCLFPILRNETTISNFIEEVPEMALLRDNQIITTIFYFSINKGPTEFQK